jgi:hypothetical protein
MAMAAAMGAAPAWACDMCPMHGGGDKAGHSHEDAQAWAEREVKNVDGAVKLNEQQLSQVQQIAQDYAGKKQQLKSQFHEQFSALHAEQDGKIAALLTPDQQSAFKTYQQKRQARMEHHDKHDDKDEDDDKKKHKGEVDDD